MLDIWLKTKSAVRVSLAKVMDKASEKLKCKYANGRAVVTYGLPIYKKWLSSEIYSLSSVWGMIANCNFGTLPRFSIYAFMRTSKMVWKVLISVSLTFIYGLSGWLPGGGGSIWMGVVGSLLPLLVVVLNHCDYLVLVSIKFCHHSCRPHSPSGWFF